MTLSQRDNFGIKAKEEDSSSVINVKVTNNEDNFLTREDIIRKMAADKVLTWWVDLVRQGRLSEKFRNTPDSKVGGGWHHG